MWVVLVDVELLSHRPCIGREPVEQNTEREEDTREHHRSGDTHHHQFLHRRCGSLWLRDRCLTDQDLCVKGGERADRHKNKDHDAGRAHIAAESEHVLRVSQRAGKRCIEQFRVRGTLSLLLCEGVER